MSVPFTAGIPRPGGASRAVLIVLLALTGGLVLPGGALAQLLPNLGGQRAGISGLTFLKNDLSPRSVAMSGANVTLSGDGHSPVLNPAAACELDELTLTVSDLAYAGGTLHHGYASAIVPTRNRGTFYGYTHLLKIPDQMIRTEFAPGGTGQYFVSYSVAAGAGYSRRLSEQFSLGVGVKYVREQLAQFYAGAVVADVGFLYRTDWQNLRFGAVLEHFGSNSTLRGTFRPERLNGQGTVTTEGYPAPTLFKMGAQLDVWREGPHLITAHGQLNHPNDNAENLRFGAEYSYGGMFLARAGFKLNVINERAPTAGIGIRANAGPVRIVFDYGVSPSRHLGLYHGLGATFMLGPVGRRRGEGPASDIPDNQRPVESTLPASN